MKKIAALVVLGAASVATAGAEESPVFVGSRVRLHTAQGSLSGNVLRWEQGQVSLINTDYGDPVVVPAESIQRMELSRGRKRPWLKNGLVGAAIGGVLGAALPVENPCPDGVQPGPTCETKTYLIQAGALSGAVIGLIVGASRQVDKWESVPPARFRIAVVPVPGGAAAALTVTH
jgi:hypothetical protein